MPAPGLVTSERWQLAARPLRWRAHCKGEDGRTEVVPFPTMVSWINGVLGLASLTSPHYAVEWSRNQSAQRVIVNTQNVNAIMLKQGWRRK